MTARVLIVDDEADLELLIRQRFRQKTRDGTYEFSFARNGQEALEVLERHPDIAVILSDINMPVMDGLTLLGRLRESGRQLGTVIVSAYGDMPNIRAAMNRGAFDFLTKPIDFQDFEVTLQKTLAQVRRLREAAADRDRLVALERDLRTAADIQQSFLPREVPFPGHGGFALHAAMLPAREVGGDFYDYFPVGQQPGSARLGLVIGDVAGKGVPAALYMAMTRTLMRAAALEGAPPGEALSQVNRQLLRDTSASLFVTLFYAVLDLGSGELTWSTGGHNPPYLLHAGGEAEPLQGRGLPLGTFEDIPYETAGTRLHPGDGLLLYTDGVTEAMDRADKPFGDERLRETLRAVGEVGPATFVAAVLENVRRFTAEAPQSDDLTVLAVRFRCPGGNGREERP